MERILDLNEKIQQKIEDMADKFLHPQSTLKDNFVWDGVTTPEENARKEKNLAKMIKFGLCRAIFKSKAFCDFFSWDHNEGELIGLFDERFSDTWNYPLSKESLLNVAESVLFDETSLENRRYQTGLFSKHGRPREMRQGEEVQNESHCRASRLVVH